jgi:O-succinylbenzoate synthase
MRVIVHLVKALRDSAIVNPEGQAAPSCVLWPDQDRQWAKGRHLNLAKMRAEPDQEAQI